MGDKELFWRKIEICSRGTMFLRAVGFTKLYDPMLLNKDIEEKAHDFVMDSIMMLLAWWEKKPDEIREFCAAWKTNLKFTITNYYKKKRPIRLHPNAPEPLINPKQQYDIKIYREAVLKRFPLEEYRRIYDLFFDDFMKPREIAEELGLTSAYVRTVVFEIRNFLRGFINGDGN